MSLTPPPIDLHRTYAVTKYSFEQVHDLHVQAVLGALADHHINGATATAALEAMVTIAEASHYGAP